MTPCEKLGYKVGDEFVVSSKNYRTRKIGTLLKLAEDDGSTQPIFKTCEGEISCPHLDWVTPLAKKAQLTPQTTTEPDIIARLTQAVKAESDLPALISELNALLPEGYEVVRTPQVAPEDMSDWRNWREGDLVECVNSRGMESCYSTGSLYRINFVDDNSCSNLNIQVQSDNEEAFWCRSLDFKFHSRPSKEAR